MLNGRAILLGILCVLFVAAAFGQEPSDPNVITVTEKIDIAGLNNNVKELSEAVKKLNETTEKLSGNVEKLTESVNNLNTRVAVLEERTQGTAKTVHVILASFIGPLVVAILAAIIIFLINRNRHSEGRVVSTNTTQVNQSDTASTQAAQESQSETAATNPTQANEGEAAPTSTSQSGLPDDKEEVKELLKSYSPDTEEKS